MKELTKAELQVMQYLWKLEKGFLKEIVQRFPEPKPAPTTVSTILRILVDKGFAAYETFGKQHRYYPAVSREDYARSAFKGVIRNFFGGSPRQFASFFTREDDLSVEDLEAMKRMLEEQIERQKTIGDDRDV